MVLTVECTKLALVNGQLIVLDAGKVKELSESDSDKMADMLGEYYMSFGTTPNEVKRTLEKVFELNEKGGPGSRKAVRELLQPLLDEKVA